VVEERPTEAPEAIEVEVAAAERTEEATAFDQDRVASILESVLFAAGEPIALKRLVEILDGPTPAEVRGALRVVAERLESEGRGVRLTEVAGGYQLRTPRENADWVRAVFRDKPRKLGRAALETLAVIAYRQPVTRAEVEAIRGVDVDAVLTTLLQRNLVRIAGRRETVGRPILYGTTDVFLELFGFRDLAELPTLKELPESSEGNPDGAATAASENPQAGAETAGEEGGQAVGEAGRQVGDPEAGEARAADAEGGEPAPAGSADEPAATADDGAAGAAARRDAASGSTPAVGGGTAERDTASGSAPSAGGGATKRDTAPRSTPAADGGAAERDTPSGSTPSAGGGATKRDTPSGSTPSAGGDAPERATTPAPERRAAAEDPQPGGDLVEAQGGGSDPRGPGAGERRGGDGAGDPGEPGERSD
jgi:segregation and condensation protein B